MKPREAVLFLMFIVKQVTAKHLVGDGHIANFLEHYKIDPTNKSPLVLIVNPNDPLPIEEDDFDDVFHVKTGVDGVAADVLVYDDDAKEQAKEELFNYLLRTGPAPENTEEEIEDAKKMAIRHILRASCRARESCEKKCPKKDNKKACTKKCKRNHDTLDLCDVPKKKCNRPNKSCGNQRY